MTTEKKPMNKSELRAHCRHLIFKLVDQIEIGDSYQVEYMTDEDISYANEYIWEIQKEMFKALKGKR